MDIRTRQTIEVAVEKGLAAALLLDLQAGAKVMSRAGVPLGVALRVLLHPGRRRVGDWQCR